MKRQLLLLLLLSAALVAKAQPSGLGFGSAVVASNDIIMVSDGGAVNAGKVYVFEQDEADTWMLNDVLQGSEAQPGDRFGHALHLNDDRLVVGAPGSPDAGAVYIFERDRRTRFWAETHRLPASPGDYIGGSLAVLDSMIVTGGVVGGPYVTVYTQTHTGWDRSTALASTDASTEDMFGLALGAYGHHIFASAPLSHSGAGSIHVFSAKTLEQEAVLTATGDTQVKVLGAALETTDDGLLLAGAPGIVAEMKVSEFPPRGSVVGFRQQSDGSWSQEMILRPTAEPGIDFFGASLSVNDQTLLVGAAGTDRIAGRTHVFVRDGEASWVAQNTLSLGSDPHLFGHSVALAGEIAVVTAPFDEGLAQVYRLDRTTGEAIRAGELSRPQTLELVPSGPAECAEGKSWQFDCQGVDLLSFLPITAIGGKEGLELNDIWGWTDPDTGGEYALVGRMDGTAFVDITDPKRPRYLGELPLTDGARVNFWRDIKVYKNHAFIVADRAGDHGMQVFDLKQLRAVPDAPETFDETAHYDRIASAHNIVINEDTGFAYIVGSSGGGEVCGGGLHMVNIKEPARPVFAGCFAHLGTGNAGSGYTHDAQCVVYHGPDIEHRGKEICLGSNQTALSIADVTDKKNPAALSSASYPDYAYTHQGWLTDDHRFFYLNDELDEVQGRVVGTRTLIWDLTDLDDPLLLGSHRSTNMASDHNLYIRGHLMYQSNYLSGLRILDITDIEAPVEVGYYDTVPTGMDKPGFGGSWSNYPFFTSGTIIITSMGEGLFVLKQSTVDL